MPAALTYPGVYIEEIPSGVRTIMGVATSITAFVGRAKKGKLNEPITINSFGDFERIFGGLWRESSMSYAVRDFYLNGGSQAIIVRLAKDATKAKTSVKLDVTAQSDGSWGNDIRFRIDEVDDKIANDVANRFKEQGFSKPGGAKFGKEDFFSLTVRDTVSKINEEYINLTIEDSPNKINKVLERSKLIKLVDVPAAVPGAHEKLPAKELDKLWKENAYSTPLADGSDGVDLTSDQFAGDGLEGKKEGLFALEKADLFNLLCIPPYKNSGDVDRPLLGTASIYCTRRRAMLIVDPPADWIDKEAAKDNIDAIRSVIGDNKKNAAIFFPRIKKEDPFNPENLEEFVPCGAVAGVFARTDTQRGVWKAPAGLDAALTGVSKLSVPLTDAENGELNPLGINCLRSKVPGQLVWGARTLDGDDRLASEWKYIPIRRLALFIEETLFRGTQWVVFEPNDEPLWAQIRLNVGAFMHSLFRQGAFQGTSPREAYFVKCDKETTTQTDRNMGIVNILVGFAPLKPAEFVVIKIQQMAGQIET